MKFLFAKSAVLDSLCGILGSFSHYGLDVSVGPSLTDEEAWAIFARGEEVVVFALLTLAQLTAQKQNTTGTDSPSTPSSMKPSSRNRPPQHAARSPGDLQATKAHVGRPSPRYINESSTAPTFSPILAACHSVAGKRKRASSRIFPKSSNRSLPNIRSIAIIVLTARSRSSRKCPVLCRDPRWPSHSGADRLVALRLGRDLVANRRCVQLTSYLSGEPRGTRTSRGGESPGGAR